MQGRRRSRMRRTRRSAEAGAGTEAEAEAHAEAEAEAEAEAHALAFFLHQTLERQERPLSFRYQLAETCGRASFERAARVGAVWVNGADKPSRLRLGDERRAMTALNAHITTIAYKIRERSGAVVHAVVIDAKDADVFRQLGKAARAAIQAIRRDLGVKFRIAAGRHFLVIY